MVELTHTLTYRINFEDSSLVRCDVVSLGYFSPTFRRKFLSSSTVVQKSRKNDLMLIMKAVCPS